MEKVNTSKIHTFIHQISLQYLEIVFSLHHHKLKNHE